ERLEQPAPIVAVGVVGHVAPTGSVCLSRRSVREPTCASRTPPDEPPRWTEHDRQLRAKCAWWAIRPFRPIGFRSTPIAQLRHRVVPRWLVVLSVRLAKLEPELLIPRPVTFEMVLSSTRARVSSSRMSPSPENPTPSSTLESTVFPTPENNPTKE